VLDKLKRLFQQPRRSRPRRGALHFTAFANDGRGGRALLGYAFWTTEVVPLERATAARS
jgi:hypothetical protein